MASEEAELEKPKFRARAFDGDTVEEALVCKTLARAYSFSSLLIHLVNKEKEKLLEDQHTVEIEIYDTDLEVWVPLNEHVEDLTDPEKRKELEKDIMAGKLGRTAWDLIT